MMNQEQAFQQIMNLRSQNVSFRDIASHLEKSGYRSALTKRPIGEQAIRNIVDKLNGVEKAAKRQDEKEEKMYVTKRQIDLRAGIDEILALRSFTDELKVRMIAALVKS